MHITQIVYQENPYFMALQWFDFIEAKWSNCLTSLFGSSLPSLNFLEEIDVAYYSWSLNWNEHPKQSGLGIKFRLNLFIKQNWYLCNSDLFSLKWNGNYHQFDALMERKLFDAWPFLVINNECIHNQHQNVVNTNYYKVI